MKIKSRWFAVLGLVALLSCARRVVETVRFEDTIDQTTDSAGCYAFDESTRTVQLMTWDTCVAVMRRVLDRLDEYRLKNEEEKKTTNASGQQL